MRQKADPIMSLFRKELKKAQPEIGPRRWLFVPYDQLSDQMGPLSRERPSDLMMTKPYVSGAAYINRMSDYCNVCVFDPKTNCPITPLYWAFLERHKDKLEGNPRLRMSMAGLGKRSESQKRKGQQIFQTVRDILRKGEVVTPETLKP